ncbi:MAG: protein kinase [Polyangiaceae bacterium]
MSPVGVTSTPPGLGSARIGRYQILGTLGAGGMAEVLLGRLVGPSGFERLVVVKRILPHLAGRRAFVDMFLDEARVVAQIRHPNVVTVHELGNEDGELFLVMEYLDGESAGGLLRRLSVKRERLPFAVAAYVVAEACAGLHAAHELTSPTGESLHVVHRDVSPQNVFVTYSGAVKVLDFGIALAGDRQTRTEAGQIKGKFEYMSPEQWREEPLDRRADVFALGIVLYELSTGHRLFRRATHLETLDAICEAPIPKPSTLVPDYPPLLERVCLRALERNREDRYATAADMRRELLPFVNAEDLEPEATLARVMAKTFADRIEEKRSMVRAARTGDALASVPPADVDETIELPLVGGPIATQIVSVPREGPAADDGAPAPSAVVATPVASTSTRSRKPVWIALGLVAAAAIGAAIFGAARREVAAPSIVPTVTASASNAIAPGVAPSSDVSPTPVDAAADAAPTEPAPATTAARPDKRPSSPSRRPMRAAPRSSAPKPERPPDFERIPL